MKDKSVELTVIQGSRSELELALVQSIFNDTGPAGEIKQESIMKKLERRGKLKLVKT